MHAKIADIVSEW